MEGHLNFKFQLNIGLKILCIILLLGYHHQVSMIMASVMECIIIFTKLSGKYL